MKKPTEKDHSHAFNLVKKAVEEYHKDRLRNSLMQIEDVYRTSDLASKDPLGDFVVILLSVENSKGDKITKGRCMSLTALPSLPSWKLLKESVERQLTFLSMSLAEALRSEIS